MLVTVSSKLHLSACSSKLSCASYSSFATFLSSTTCVGVILSTPACKNVSLIFGSPCKCACPKISVSSTGCSSTSDAPWGGAAPPLWAAATAALGLAGEGGGEDLVSADLGGGLRLPRSGLVKMCVLGTKTLLAWSAMTEARGNMYTSGRGEWAGVGFRASAEQASRGRAPIARRGKSTHG